MVSYINNIIKTLIILSMCACSTKKSTFFTRAYHNTTTHYNWYFNAQNIINEVEQKIQQNQKDDYNEILTVYKSASTKDSQSFIPSLNKAIKKGAQAINEHSILLKNKEHNRWVDDCYLTIAKAFYYKKDFLKAAEAFRQVSNMFPETPSDYKAQVWLCRTYIDQKDMTSADLLLNKMLSNESFPDKLNSELSLVASHFYLKNKIYTLAKEELLMSINLSKKKKRARIYFILAQINAIEKNYSQATKFFEKAINSSSNYELTFNAKIKRAQSYDIDFGDVEKIKKELQDMLGDEKNIEYKDVIYFSLAEISIREKLIDEAINYYKKSVSKSQKNNSQKALSSFRLAEIYYKNKKYRPAQSYFDTTIAYMDPNNPSFNQASKKQSTLSELVYNLNLIIEQDSLLRVSRLPESERNAIINKVIAEVQKKEQEQKILEQQNMNDSRFFGDRINNSNQAQQIQGRMWYFDNPTALSFGYSEFTRKWGKRKLEDNWRRKNKQTVLNNDLSQDSISNSVFDPKNKQSYIDKLLLSDEKQEVAEKKILTSYYSVAVIYKDKLQDYKEAINTLNALNNRFPENINKSTVYYQLFLLYQLINEAENVEKYKNIILQQFPNSEYARIIKNPKLLDVFESKQKNIQALYDEAYSAYLENRYDDVVKTCKKGISLDSLNILTPHFSLLSAICKGFLGGKPELISSLKKVKLNHENHPVSITAEEILSQVTNKTNENRDKEANLPTNEEEALKYVYKNETPHFFIFLFKDFDVDVNTGKEIFSNYHSDFYPLEKLNISSVLLDEQTHMISVRDFEDGASAMKYYESFISSDESGPFGNDYVAFVISSKNFPLFFKNKDVQGYSTKFKEMYLRQ